MSSVSLMLSPSIAIESKKRKQRESDEFRGKLCGWAVPALPIPSTPHWADHTFATFQKKTDIWGCASGSGGYDPDNSDTRLIARRKGSRNRARCIGKANSGIIWAVTGFCHQCTNRVLFPASTTVSRARGYAASTAMFGTYGGAIIDWEALKASCGYGPFFQDGTYDDDDFYAKNEKEYFRRIFDAYINGSSNFSRTMGSDLEIQLEFFSEKDIDRDILSDLQNSQYIFQMEINKNYSSYTSQEINHNEFNSNSKKLIENFFQSFLKRLGHTDYFKVFELPPDELSNIVAVNREQVCECK